MIETTETILNQEKSNDAYLNPKCKICYHSCTCPEDIHFGVKYCPNCGYPVCPDCGSADVIQISRVTGYLSDVGGWNNAKKQELKDRRRYNIGGNNYDR